MKNLFFFFFFNPYKHLFCPCLGAGKGVWKLGLYRQSLEKGGALAGRQCPEAKGPQGLMEGLARFPQVLGSTLTSF